MNPGITEVWARIEAHAGEKFTLTRGGKYSYEVRDNVLTPVGRLRPLSKRNFANALDRLPLHNTLTVGDLQGSSYVFSILMDPRISRGQW